MGRRTSRLSSWWALVLVWGWAVPASAQEETAGVRAQALAAFQRGVSAADTGNYPEAIAAFSESIRLRPLAGARINLALAYRGAARTREAISTLEQLLIDLQSSTRPALRQQVETELASLRTQLTRFTITVVPESAASAATVTIDGQAITALRPGMELDARPQTLQVTVPGYRPVSRVLQGRSGESAEIRIELERMEVAARLSIEPSQPQAQVILDGVLVGIGAVHREVRPGTHALELRAPGYVPYHAVLELANGSVTRVSPTLEAEPVLATPVPVAPVPAPVVRPPLPVSYTHLTLPTNREV